MPDKSKEPHPDRTLKELLATSKLLTDRAAKLADELRQLASEIQEQRAIRKDRASRGK